MKRVTISTYALGTLAILLAVLLVLTAFLCSKVLATEALAREIIQTQARTAIIAAQTDENGLDDEFTIEPVIAPQIADFSTDISEPITQEPLGAFTVTYYCPCEICCGAYADGITASGTVATEGRTAACDYLPLGTLVNVDGHIYTVEDRFGAFDGSKTIDIYVEDHERALQLGTHTSEVSLVTLGGAE